VNGAVAPDVRTGSLSPEAKENPHECGEVLIVKRLDRICFKKARHTCASKDTIEDDRQ